MRKRNLIYLKHMLDAISRIEEYTEGKTYEVIQDGTIRQIEIIGEATKRL